MKIILTENQVQKVINELSLSGVVEEFIEDVKRLHLFSKVKEAFPSIKNFKDFEQELKHMDYGEFDEFRSLIIP